MVRYKNTWCDHNVGNPRFDFIEDNLESRILRPPLNALIANNYVGREDQLQAVIIPIIAV